MSHSQTHQVHAGNASYEGYILRLGPVGYWRLAEVNGTVCADLGSGANAGTYTNTPTFGQLGPVARDSATGIAFASGSSEYVAFGDLADLELDMPLSWCAWMQLASLPSNGASMSIAGKYDAAGNEREYLFYVASANDKLRLLRSSNGTATDFAELATAFVGGDLNTWFHVAITVDAGGDWVCYKNGVADGSGTYGTAVIYHGGANFIIASRHDMDLFWNGKLAEVVAFNKELTAGEVEALYLIGKHGP